MSFLDEFLPADAYLALFEALQSVAVVESDVKAVARRCRALSAVAYGAAMAEQPDRFDYLSLQTFLVLS